MNRSILIIILLIAFNVFVWYSIIFYGPNKALEFYFLDVGQGDAGLVLFPGGVKVLIDGGPNSKVLDELNSILRPTDRYIDLVVSSHPQTDHFAGLIDVLNKYEVGVFISSGKRGPAQSFAGLEKAIERNKIPAVSLMEGDKIKYSESRFSILSPSANLLQSKEPNDWGLVMNLESDGIKALFTGDIDAKIEKDLAKKYNLNTDILKVAHHGSKFSSSEEFLKAATPKIALIEVGKNSYGHPAPDTLNRLVSVGSQIFRTDESGTIKLIFVGSKIFIWEKK